MNHNRKEKTLSFLANTPAFEPVSRVWQIPDIVFPTLTRCQPKCLLRNAKRILSSDGVSRRHCPAVLQFTKLQTRNIEFGFQTISPLHLQDPSNTVQLFFIHSVQSSYPMNLICDSSVPRAQNSQSCKNRWEFPIWMPIVPHSPNSDSTFLFSNCRGRRRRGKVVNSFRSAKILYNMNYIDTPVGGAVWVSLQWTKIKHTSIAENSM